MLKKIAMFLVILPFLMILVFGSALTYDYVYYSFNSGEYAWAVSHRSVGKVTCEFQIVFKDPAVNLMALMFGMPTACVKSGSSFYFDKDYPYMLTNNHVVETPKVTIPLTETDAAGNEVAPEFEIVSKYYVTMDDGTVYPCKVIATFPEKDIALLRVDTKEWRPLPFADLSKLRVGEKVFAIGSPLGFLINSFTDGVVSHTNRNLSEVEDMAGYPARGLRSWTQHTAHVNPGNSGGPLVNRYGEVIGINSLSFNGEQISGIYFAIDINLFEMPKYWLVAAPEETQK